MAVRGWPEMAHEEDVALTKQVRRDFIRHHIDMTLADVRVSHGVVYIRGTLRPEGRNASVNLKEECERIARNLRTRPGVRDVVLDVLYRT